MSSSRKRFQLREDDIYELKDLRSNDDNSSLIESPNSQKSLNLRKLRPKNRVRSPQFSPESNYESSITLSPITKNAFFAKDPHSRNTTPKSISPANSSSIYTDHSDQSQNVLEKFKKSSPNLEVQSHISDKSSVKLYREQIRNRFLSIKQQAGFTAIQTKKHGRKRKHRLKKFKNEIELETEDSYLNIELSNHSKKRELLRKNKSEYLSQGDLFDCRISITQEENNQLTESEINKEEKIEEIESNVHQQTIIELLHLDEKEMTNFVKPLLCKEVYNPSTLCEFDKDVISLKKFDDNVELRYLEEEGLYVGEKPPVTKKMIGILERRLLSTGNRNWFGCDGELKFLSDPRREVLLKPLIDQPISSELITFYKLPIKFEPGLLSLTQTNEKHLLKIEISKIKFKHHPLFSPEHFLAQRLEHLCKDYNSNKKEINHIKLQNKLQTLRQAKQKILQALQEDEQNVTQKQKERLNQYRIEIQKTRELRFQEYKNYRELVKSILKTWKYLKQVREKQNFVNTSVRLVIKKQKGAYNDEKKQWDDLIEIETNEIYEELKIKYIEALQEYKTELKHWKSRKDDIDEKPVKPIKEFSIDSIRQEVAEMFMKSMKPPGEPQLNFELHLDQEITKDVQFPREKARRNAVNKTKLNIKILFDDLQVFKTNSVNLNDTFVCEINQMISVECIAIPTNIYVEIQEEYRSSNNKWSYTKISLPPPDTDITFENVEKQQYNFNHTQTVMYTHTGIGMGHNFQNIFDAFSLDNIDNIDNIHLSGLIYLKLGWDNEHLPPSRPDTKISSLIEANQFDPHDPQNKDFVNYIQQSSHIDDDKKLFRLDIGEDIFCTDEDIENNPRFRMLSLRSKGEFEFQNQVIPNRENQIDLNIFVSYEKRKKEELETFTVDEYTNENQIDTQRQWGIRQYQQIMKRAVDLCKTADKIYSLKNILIDDEVPDLSSIFFSLFKWFQPKRPLRPARKSSNQVILSSVPLNNVIDLKIVINIVQAFQVPIRRTLLQEITVSPTKRSNSDLFSLISVRPLVMASFDKQIYSTTTAEGSNPTWNQELVLSVQYKQNETINESICLNLFDEQLVDILEDDRYRQIDIHHRRQLHWLASLQIPLQTVTETNRIEGTFEMNSPSFIIGYEKVIQNKDDTIILPPKSTFESRDSTYLNLFITLIPPINGIQILKDDNLECNEVTLIETHIRTWQEDYNLLFPSRSFPVLIKDSNCKTCCITRFLKALNPPDFDKEISVPIENLCIRLVTLIPFKKNVHYSGIWLTSDQFLKLQIGSISDHAVLLQCYLMYLNVESWLAFGYCMLQGRTAFVVYKETSENNENVYYAVDIITGNRYDVRHSFNPFKRIFCLINHENVWANVQKEDQMNLIRYDISKSSDWLPLFTKQIISPTSSFQPNILEYCLPTDLQKLEERIEIKLKSKIMKMRQHTRTLWNRHASFILKQLLPLLEKHQLLGGSGVVDFSDNQNLMLDIQTLMNTHKTYGFPINLPYTTISAICEAVQKTNIHNNDAPNMEFALAVYLHEYTGGILVVWIYICNLIRRR